MKKTYSVSFPRSGHHWLVHILQAYFGDEFHYCESYKQPHLHLGVWPKTNFHKTHDFELNFDPGSVQVLVQVRRDIGAAMKSWHKFEGEKEALADFAAKRQDYWIGFMAKWWLPDAPNRLLVWYEDLKANPVLQVTRVVRFLDDAPVDQKRLIQCISGQLKWPQLGLSDYEKGIDYSI